MFKKIHNNNIYAYRVSFKFYELFLEFMGEFSGKFIFELEKEYELIESSDFIINLFK